MCLRSCADTNFYQLREEVIDKSSWAASLTPKLTTAEIIAQCHSPWGLVRISHTDRPKSNNYIYDSSAGNGTNVYVLDSGIFTENALFGGRATWGTTIFGGQSSSDSNGHGTHCAGVIASVGLGVAQKANVIAVKTISDDLIGDIPASIAGVKWALVDHQKNMALNGTGSGNFKGSVIYLNPGSITIKGRTNETDSLNQAINTAVEAGIPVVVPAGDDNSDECTSIAQSKALIVGASTDDDKVARFSNFGSCISLFAPGQNILSTSIDDPESVTWKSSTGLAAAHVAGLLAYFSALQPAADPKSTLLSIASPNKLKNLHFGIPNVGFYCAYGNRVRADSVSFLPTTIEAA